MGGGVEIGAHEIDFPADSRPVVESFVADVTKGMFPLTINFTCTAYDPNGQIVSYETNFGDGTPLEQSADGELTHTYTKSGYYYATCTPVDNQGNKTNSKSIKLTIGIILVPEDQVSIQNAIDFAPIHAIIIVNQGEYKESLQIDKPLSLKSLFGQRYTTLHAEQSDDHAISVNASNVIIDGFSIYGATETGKAGIYLSNSAHNCIIMNNRLGWSHNRNNNYGIFLDSGSSENQIINNALAYSDVGIFMENSDFNYISENICTLNSYGIVIQQSSGNHIENNTFNQNNEAGIQVLSSTSNFIRFNRFNNNKYGIYEQFSSNNTIDTNEFISIYISNHYIEKSPNKKVIPAIYLLLLN